MKQCKGKESRPVTKVRTETVLFGSCKVLKYIGKMNHWSAFRSTGNSDVKALH